VLFFGWGFGLGCVLGGVGCVWGGLGFGLGWFWVFCLGFGGVLGSSIFAGTHRLCWGWVFVRKFLVKKFLKICWGCV
jgi:hypothetical protein